MKYVFEKKKKHKKKSVSKWAYVELFQLSLPRLLVHIPMSGCQLLPEVWLTKS